MKKNIYILLILPFVVFSQKNNDKQLGFDENFFEAVNYRIKGDYIKSNDFFQKCLQITPDNDVILFKIAQNFEDDKQYDLAETYIKQALKINDKNKWYHKIYIEIQIDKGTDEKAVNKLIEEFKKIAKNKYLIRDLYRKQMNIKRDDVVASFYVDKENKNKKKSKTNSLILKLIQQKKYKQIISEGEKMLEKNPDNANTYYFIAIAYKNIKNFNKSIEYLDMGIDFAMDDKTLLKKYYKAYIDIYKQKGNIKKEKKYIKKINKI